MRRGGHRSSHLAIPHQLGRGISAWWILSVKLAPVDHELGWTANTERSHSGWLLSALAGILVGAVWNDAVTAVYTWKRPRAG
jgi:hypothetical protein